MLSFKSDAKVGVFFYSCKRLGDFFVGFFRWLVCGMGESVVGQWVGGCAFLCEGLLVGGGVVVVGVVAVAVECEVGVGDVPEV